MTYPVISTLPVAPSRIGDPDNFVTESLAFLEAQVDFVTECNAVASYFNSANFDQNNWGDLSPVGEVSPVYITNFINAAPSTTLLSGAPLAIAIDGLLASMVAFVPDANNVSAWIDTVVDPLAPVIVDPARPTISTIAATPLRNDGKSEFESKSIAFYSSAHLFSTSFQQYANYISTFSVSDEDWGEIAVTYTETDDWGLIV